MASGYFCGIQVLFFLKLVFFLLLFHFTENFLIFRVFRFFVQKKENQLELRKEQVVELLAKRWFLELI